MLYTIFENILCSYEIMDALLHTYNVCDFLADLNGVWISL